MVKLMTLLRRLKYKLCALYNEKERFASLTLFSSDHPCGWQTCPNGNCFLFANLLNKYIKVLKFFWISQTMWVFQFYSLKMCIIYMVFRQLVLLLGQRLYKSQTSDRPGVVQWNLGSRTPLFTNNSVHEQISPAKTVSDDERCLGLRTRKLATAASWRQRQAESIGAGVSVAG
jgi:hypothetical protein